MGLKYNHLGDECKSRKQQKRGNLYGQGGSFRQSCFCMNNKRTKEKKSIGAGATMEGEFWSIFGAED
jgi:hypothetical protein